MESIDNGYTSWPDKHKRELVTIAMSNARKNIPLKTTWAQCALEFGRTEDACRRAFSTFAKITQQKTLKKHYENHKNGTYIIKTERRKQSAFKHLQKKYAVSIAKVESTKSSIPSPVEVAESVPTISVPVTSELNVPHSLLMNAIGFIVTHCASTESREKHLKNLLKKSRAEEEQLNIKIGELQAANELLRKRLAQVVRK